MTPQWIWERNSTGDARFSLGCIGSNPLVCFGINPSIATPDRLDPTVTRVRNFADRLGYDGWIMLNIYPQISTDPKGMHLNYDTALKKENERHIAKAVSGRSTLVAGWGTEITRRPYLRPLLRDILDLPEVRGAQWVSLGAPLRDGHPAHPSRRPNNSRLQLFDLDTYQWAQP